MFESSLTGPYLDQDPISLAALSFIKTPWSNIPTCFQGRLVPALPMRRPQLLGGSSKLAKLAEERRKKAASSQDSPSAPGAAPSPLDRLSRPKETKENEPPPTKAEPKKYPIRKKKEPSPPPKEPSPPPVEAGPEMPDLRASPTSFGRALSTGTSKETNAQALTVDDILGSSPAKELFTGPSPDDVVLRAQQRTKAPNK